MDTTHTRLLALTVALVLTLPPGAPSALPAQVPGSSEGIVVIDFANSNPGRPHALSQLNIPLRNGTGSTIRVIKNLIDLVPDGLINLDGGTISGPIIHGRTTGGIGFIQMNAAPAGLPPLGVVLHVGASDHFTFQSVHKGLITSVTFNPNPTTIAAGTPFTVSVQGDDLGSPAISQGGASCHSVTVTGSSSTALTATLTRLGSCAGNIGPFSFTLHGGVLGDPPSYATSNGTKTFSFGPYACPLAGLGAPVINAPTDGQLLVFPRSLDSTRSVTVRWSGRTDSGLTAPFNEWVVTTILHLPKGSVGPDPSTSTTVTGTQTSLSLGVPGSYTVRVRARNCGAPAPEGSVSFTLRFL